VLTDKKEVIGNRFKALFIFIKIILYGCILRNGFS